MHAEPELKRSQSVDDVHAHASGHDSLAAQLMTDNDPPAQAMQAPSKLKSVQDLHTSHPGSSPQLPLLNIFGRLSILDKFTMAGQYNMLYGDSDSD